MRIGLDHNLKKTYLILETLQAVAGGKKTVASSGKFYQLPPDKENTAWSGCIEKDK